MAGKDSSVRPSVQDLDLDELELRVRKALGIAMALSESSNDEHDRFAAEAIVDYLSDAKMILEAAPRLEALEAPEATLQ